LNRKWIPYLLVAVLALVLFLVRRQPVDSFHTGTRTESSGKKINRDRGFDRRISYLQYSNHAKCRMDCRKISRAEVEQVMKEGRINYRKSELKNIRCPRYALEGTTSDGQRVRIVYAQCDESTTVVTVIDLERDWQCDCPGDKNGKP